MMTNELIVHGLVQGVGFRWMTKMLAEKLHVFGTVENLQNGDVRIIAQATPEIMEQFIQKVRESPSPSGHVSDIRITELPNTEQLHSFRVTG